MIGITRIFLLVGILVATVDCNVTSQKGPVLIPSHNEIVLQKGQNFTLLCKSHHSINFKQQETTEDTTFSLFKSVQNQIFDPSYKYSIALELTNVDEYAVGYYACFDDTLNQNDVLYDLTEEPKNTEHISYMYIYVNGTNKIFAPMGEIIKSKSGDKVVIECRPTMPNVSMILTYTDFPATGIILAKPHNPKIGFVLNNEDIFDFYNEMTCIAQGNLRNDTITFFVVLEDSSNPPRPKIETPLKYFLKGTTFVLNCSATTTINTSATFNLEWILPENVVGTVSAQIDGDKHTAYKTLTVENANVSGEYVCKSKHLTKEKKMTIHMYLEDPNFLHLELVYSYPTRTVNSSMAEQFPMSVDIETADLHQKYYYTHNGKNITHDGTKYIITEEYKKHLTVTLYVKKPNIYDSGRYVLNAVNALGEIKSVETYFDVTGGPFIDFNEDDKTFVKGRNGSLVCTVESNPLNNLIWMINGQRVDRKYYSLKNETNYRWKSILTIPIEVPGNVSCIANNVTKTRRILVNDLDGGFGILVKDNSGDEKEAYKYWIPENYDLTITCLASKHNYTNATWLDATGKSLDSIAFFYSGELSHKVQINIRNISLDKAGTYTCQGISNKFNVSRSTKNIFIEVAELKPTTILYPAADTEVEVIKNQLSVRMSCQAEGIPLPKVEWKKDGKPLVGGTANVTQTLVGHSKINVTLGILEAINNNNTGKYECVFTGNGEPKRRIFNVAYKAYMQKSLSPLHLSIIIGVIIVLLIAVLYLTWKNRKNKQFRKELKAIGLLYFKEGRKLNPDLGLDQQAELLPYDDRFEFPREKLIIEETLGSGAFGEVFKARAQGILNAERTDIVAVKMVKKTADNSCIRALASELKIMVHLGKHINILNLLGACTKNIGKRELLVIVEYCEFGNLHSYVRRHREVFIDQLTGNKECGRVNKGYSCSSNNSSGMQSDYFTGTNQTQNTEHTFLNTGNSNRSSRLAEVNNREAKEIDKASECSNMTDCRSEWNEYSDGRKLRPLNSRDLLAWSFQIARGMEYLAGRKVLHGDLAARNILLANDNIVKICDFGLARSVYKDEEYKKQENSLLPVKWLAIECMTDRIFSTQSDVWAFGIVLWELFSLAKTPYPSVSHADLLDWLQQGNRLEKPAHADERIYEVMLKCWQHKPNARPNFTSLQEIMGSFLEDNVRNHYVDLNTEYINSNVAHEGEDYLAMVAAPDYNNIVTPSPNHQYVNVDKQFFPSTPTPHDEEGYLQMTPRVGLTPRDHNKFEFNSGSHELTPMLSIHNLPTRSCSESDQEGNMSPYPKLCPPIEEEDADEVFETKQNNHKNTFDTVTNPTYITFSAEIEKKPDYEKKVFPNNYVNIPNLVK